MDIVNYFCAYLIVLLFYLQHFGLCSDLKTQTTYTCEGDVLKIECPKNQHIEIVRANYGRLNPTLCSHEQDTRGWDLNCMSENSLSTVSQQCQNKVMCQISASRPFFGEACLNTPKYLEIEYGCEDDSESEKDKLVSSSHAPKSMESIEAESYDGGDDNDREYFCPSVSKRKIEWPKTRPGEVVQRPCPNNQAKMAAWQCGWNPVSWIYRPDLSNCVSQNIINIGRKINESDKDAASLINVMSELSAISVKFDFFGGDLNHVANAIKDTVQQIDAIVFNTTQEEEEVAIELNKAVVRSSSELMSNRNNDSWHDLPPKYQADVLNHLMTSVETSGFKLARAARSAERFQHVEPNIAVKVLSVGTDHEVKDVIFPDEEIFKGKTWLDEGDSIKLTGKAVKGAGNTHVVLAIYKNLDQLLHKNCTNSDTSNENLLHSKVISASIRNDDKETKDLKEPIVFTLRHTNNVSVNQVFCSFWNVLGSEEGGWWSSSGCHVVSSNSTHTTCSCDHLTHFAILMSVSPHNVPDSSIHLFSLSLITYFGCIVSIICLVMSFLTFIFIKSLNSDRDTIHRHLFITLCLSEAIFLHSISPYNTPLSCLIVAVLLHYCFLVAFMWMGLEGLQLYVMLVEVFDVERSRVVWYYVSAYGLPFIIVASTLAVSPGGYETEKYCWLKVENGFIWAFVGPVCAILLVNLAMLFVALRAMYQHTKSPAANWKFKQSGKAAKFGMWIKGAFMLIILLGLTWVFGLLYVNNSSIFMAYLFTILNSFQGLFIFIFHCLLYDKVIKEYRKVFHRISGFQASFLNMFSGNSSKSMTNSLSNDRSSSLRKSKLLQLFSLRKSTSTTRQSSSFLQSKHLPSAVDNSYHPTDSGYGEEHIYNEPTEDDPSFYLEPIKIKMNFDPDLTTTTLGRTFSLEEDFSLIEGSVAYTEYLDDNRNQVSRRFEEPPKGRTFDVDKYRIDQRM